MDDLMKEVSERLQAISDAEKEIKNSKERLSGLLEIIKHRHPETEKKFQWNGSWYLIKKRAGNNFISNFGDVEPGSWLKKENKKEDL